MDTAQILSHLEHHHDADRMTDDVLPTGSVTLDMILGGGWPAGAISEACGPPGYAEAIAYRTVAAVQRAHPGSLVIFCGRDFSLRRASQAGLDTHRLLVTHSQDAAVAVTDRDPPPRLAVIDHTLSADIPVRDDKQLAVLYLTRSPGDVRSTACVELARYGGTQRWCWAERMWHTWQPSRLRWSTMPVCLGRNPDIQDTLHAAVHLGIVKPRGRWYSYGGHRLGSGWKETAERLAAAPRLYAEILAEVAGTATVYPGWQQAYT